MRSSVCVGDINNKHPYNVGILLNFSCRFTFAGSCYNNYTDCFVEPFDSPRLSLTFTSSCVTLNIESPQVPNGVITHYNVRYF